MTQSWFGIPVVTTPAAGDNIFVFKQPDLYSSGEPLRWLGRTDVGTPIYDQLAREYAYPPIYAALCEALGERVPAWRAVAALPAHSELHRRVRRLAEDRSALLVMSPNSAYRIISAAIA